MILLMMAYFWVAGVVTGANCTAHGGWHSRALLAGALWPLEIVLVVWGHPGLDP